MKKMHFGENCTKHALPMCKSAMTIYIQLLLIKEKNYKYNYNIYNFYFKISSTSSNNSFTLLNTFDKCKPSTKI